MRDVFLGWDVGAWHCEKGESRDALCALVLDEHQNLRLAGRPWRGGLRQVMNGFAGEDLVRALLARVEVDPPADASVTVAIDAALGWPAAFTALLTHRRIPKTVADFKFRNELLYRHTDRLLIQDGHRPLSVVQDMISSQSTKGMVFLGRAGLKLVETGVWASRDVGGFRCTAIETYPAPCERSGALGDFFTELSGRKSFVEALPRSEVGKKDMKDALYCALVAFAFAHDRDNLMAPEEVADEIPAEEGWIWVPKRCYPSLLAGTPSRVG